MDWDQAKLLSESIAVAISESMQAGFSHMHDGKTGDKGRITVHDFYAGCSMAGMLANPSCDMSREALEASARLDADAMMERRR